MFIKTKYDSNNNRIYFEDENGFWVKRIFNYINEEIYFENSDGEIIQDIKIVRDHKLKLLLAIP